MDVVQDSEELRDRRQHAGLAAAIPTTLLAMKRRTVFIFDNGDRSVRISRQVGRSADDGLQPDSGPQRIQRQRIPGVAAGKKRVKALSIRRPVDLGGKIVHLPMTLASSAAIIIMPFFS
ncbi:MAG TPA: hypothetical protein VK137_16140 [Planctomycetaceae bacterium]|nr:hypothetical protein [Planctomycetaceae bacterium]